MVSTHGQARAISFMPLLIQQLAPSFIKTSAWVVRAPTHTHSTILRRTFSQSFTSEMLPAEAAVVVGRTTVMELAPVLMDTTEMMLMRHFLGASQRNTSCINRWGQTGRGRLLRGGWPATTQLRCCSRMDLYTSSATTSKSCTFMILQSYLQRAHQCQCSCHSLANFHFIYCELVVQIQLHGQWC